MTQPEYDDDVNMMWTQFRREIDKRLDAIRPQRASVGEKEWREPVYGWARNHIPDETNLVRRFAEREVDTREREATKRGNEHLRRWMRGQLALTWADIGPLPVKVGKLRIRLDAATPEDLDDAAGEVQADGLRTWNEVLLLAETMRDLAKQARHHGYVVVALLGDLPPRHEEEPA